MTTQARPRPGWLWTGSGDVHRVDTQPGDRRESVWSRCGVQLGDYGGAYPYPHPETPYCPDCQTEIERGAL